MSKFRHTTLGAENEKLDFVQRAIELFDKNAGLVSVGDLAPGSYFAIRHGLGNDCLLVFRLDPEHEPEIFADCLDPDVSRTASGVAKIIQLMGPKTGWHNQRLAMLETILKEYKNNNPARTADNHDESCCCIRCVTDKIRGYLKDPAVKR